MGVLEPNPPRSDHHKCVIMGEVEIPFFFLKGHTNVNNHSLLYLPG